MALFGGLYNGLQYTHRSLSSAQGIQDLDDFLDLIVSANKQDSVVSVFEMPSIFVPSEQTTDDTTKAISYRKTIPLNIQLDGGYTPRNKKLYTYPYNFIVVSTGNSSREYRFEYSNKEDAYHNKAITFEYSCGMSPNPEILVYPLDYASVTTNDTPNMDEVVLCTGFPQCAFVIDSFRAWLAQNASNFVGTLAGAGVGAITGGIGAVVGAVGISGTISSLISNATKGSTTKGTQGTSTEVAIGAKGIYFKYYSVQEEFARVIDDYFDRYGYACCEIKVPNRKVREHWTYTKTKNCCVTGNAPVSAIAKIKEIYNNGITFWVSGNDVGNYNQTNNVLST